MTPFEYKIIRRKRRKTACIQVSADNEVAIIVPRNLSDERIRAIIEKKTPWILKTIKFNKEVKHPHKPKAFVDGEAFTYLGHNYRLNVVKGEGQVEMKNGRLNVYVSENGRSGDKYIRSELIGWYRRHACLKLRDRVSMYADSIGVAYKQIKVKDIKSRWGSCSKAGNINFNWRIIMAPVSIVDYVVIHELCHLVHHDHSALFWKLVESFVPDYREKKQWLRKNGAMLGI